MGRARGVEGNGRTSECQRADGRTVVGSYLQADSSMIIGPSRKHICICTWRVLQRGGHGPWPFDGWHYDEFHDSIRNIPPSTFYYAPSCNILLYYLQLHCYFSDKAAILCSINDRTRQCFNKHSVRGSARLGGSWSSWQEPIHLPDKTRANSASQEPNSSWRREGVSAQTARPKEGFGLTVRVR